MVSQRLLSRGEKDALKRLDVGDWRRVPGGYHRPGESTIQHATANGLLAYGLASTIVEHGIPKLKITELGRATVEKMKAKAGAA